MPFCTRGKHVKIEIQVCAHINNSVLEEKNLADSTGEELSRARILLKKGKYKSALKLVEKLAKQDRFSTDENLACRLIESRLRIKLGELERSFSLINEILQTIRSREDSLRARAAKIEALIVEAEILWRWGKLDEGLRVVKEAEEHLEEKRLEHVPEQEEWIKLRRGELLHQEGILNWYKGDLDRAMDCHKQSLAIKKELDDRNGVADSFNNIGLVYWSKGDLDRAMEYYQRSLAIREKLDNKHGIATSLNNLGNAYSMKGDLDRAMEYYQRSLAIREKLDNKHNIALSLNNLGVVHRLKGNLDRAMEYYQRSLRISEEFGIKRDVALALNNLGEILQLKGELNQALKYFQRSLPIYQELGIRQDIAMSLLNIGEVYGKKGNPEEALNYYQRSLSIYKEVGNELLTATTLFELVRTALEKRDSAQVKQYLQELQQISERTDNRIINQRYRIAKALHLKASRRARHKTKAGEILERVVQEEVGDHSLTVTAMIHLCDLLLSELKITGDDELLQEIKDLTDRLLRIAKLQSSHSLLAETYLLQSKLSLIELDMGRARKLLTKAHLIAMEKGLHKLARAVVYERDLLQSQLHKWNLLMKENPSRQELIGLTRLDDLLERMIHKTVASLLEEKRLTGVEPPRRKYELVYLDFLRVPQKIEREKFTVGVAQIGKSQDGDLLNEFYEEMAPGLFRLKEKKVDSVRLTIKRMVEMAFSKQVNILIFPELTIDLNHDQLLEDILALAKAYKMYIVPGSYHDQITKQNLSAVISPEGLLWKQEKHTPAIIRIKGKEVIEGIDAGAHPRKNIIGNTEFGRIAIIICRDFLDMDLRVEMKNFEPPVDIIINPAFTPVTADFKAAHFDARRSIYAYCFFANVAEFGESFIYTPEKERVERIIPSKEESLIYKDISLFKLRSERKKWEIKQKKKKSFIQSTR